MYYHIPNEAFTGIALGTKLKLWDKYCPYKVTLKLAKKLKVETVYAEIINSSKREEGHLGGSIG